MSSISRRHGSAHPRSDMDGPGHANQSAGETGGDARLSRRPREAPDYAALDVTDGPFCRMWRAPMPSTPDTIPLAGASGRSGAMVSASPGCVARRGAEPQRLSLPYGKFQPPFFDPRADDALNYGALAQRWAMKSRICSTTIAVNMTPRAICAIGGPPPMPRLTRQGQARHRSVQRDDRQRRACERRSHHRREHRRSQRPTIAYYALQRELKAASPAHRQVHVPNSVSSSPGSNFRERPRRTDLPARSAQTLHSPAEARVNVPFSNMPDFSGLRLQAGRQDVPGVGRSRTIW